PEILRHGKTGFIAENKNEFADYMKQIKEISRRTCREEAEQRFNISSMAKNYEKVFASLIAKIIR
ncbi:MAG: glycosyl transferase, partial [Candidatus Moranbacteria bacterium CG_4_9_14_3_um_filter_42_9]